MDEGRNLYLSEKLSTYTTQIIRLGKQIRELRSIMSRIDGINDGDESPEDKIPSNCFMQFDFLNTELKELNDKLENIISRF